jgi:hypothetical protein
LFLEIENINKLIHIINEIVKKLVSNHGILFGFTTTFIYFHKFAFVNIQKNNEVYAKNQKIHNL